MNENFIYHIIVEFGRILNNLFVKGANFILDKLLYLLNYF